MSKDDRVRFECHDDADSVLKEEENLEEALKSFRESLWWDDNGEESKHPSTHDEEGE